MQFSKQMILCKGEENIRKLYSWYIYGSIVVEEELWGGKKKELSGSLESLMSAKLVQPGVNVVSLTEFFKHRQKVEQLSVIYVVKPWQHRNSIIRVKDVGGRRIIQDEGFVEVSAQTTQIFNIAALVEYARFPE